MGKRSFINICLGFPEILVKCNANPLYAQPNPAGTRCLDTSLSCASCSSVHVKHMMDPSQSLEKLSFRH